MADTQRQDAGRAAAGRPSGGASEVLARTEARRQTSAGTQHRSDLHEVTGVGVCCGLQRGRRLVHHDVPLGGCGPHGLPGGRAGDPSKLAATVGQQGQLETQDNVVSRGKHGNVTGKRSNADVCHRRWARWLRGPVWSALTQSLLSCSPCAARIRGHLCRVRSGVYTAKAKCPPRSSGSSAVTSLRNT